MISIQAGKAETGASRRNRHILCHAISIVFIILVSLVLFYKHFATRGMLMHVDMTFPTTISRNLALYNHTWWEYGSVQNIWNIQRIFWTYPLLGAVKLFNISTDRYLLIMFISTFALAGISMYALAFYVLKRFKLGAANKYALHVGAVFAALIFMYNPFSVSHLWPYFGYPGYAVLPLVFLLLVIAVDKPRAWNVILLAVLISVAGTGPINVVWYWAMILGYLVFYLVSRRFDRSSLVTAGKVVAPLAGLYVLLNALWIVPYFGSQIINKPFTPTYIGGFSRSMLDTLSKSGTILNNVRFTAGWGLPVNPEPSGTFWVILSFALPISALAALLVLRRKTVRDRIVLFWSIMFVLSVLLATGTSFVIARPYSWFVLKAPLLSSFGWVFRAADRWLIYAAVFYALILGLLVAYLLRNLDSVKNFLAYLVVAVVLASFVPVSLSYAKNVYNPTRIPPDYASVTNAMEQSAPAARPIWLPFASDGFHYSWAPEKRVGPFDVYSSNASLNNIQDLFNADNYYYWLESLFEKTMLGPGEVLNKQLLLPRDIAAKLFIPFAARYMILDSSVPGYTIADSLKNDRTMRSVQKTQNLEVFKIEGQGRPVRAAPRTVTIDSYWDELAIAQRLTASQLEAISFADRKARISRSLGAIDLRDYMDPYDINSGFEEIGADGKPAKWNLTSNVNPFKRDTLQSRHVLPDLDAFLRDRKVTVSLDKRIRTGGRRSLKIVNPSTIDLSVYTVAGTEIPVTQGEVYNIKTSVRFMNSKWTSVMVEGFDVQSNKWVKLVSCPPVQSGSLVWAKSNTSFLMPSGISKIKPLLIAGWASEGQGPAVSWFDDIKISKLDERFFSKLLDAPAPPAISYKQLSPEKYEVQVRGASAPFMLAFSEAYDPLWVARTEDGKTVDPARLYSTITGFPVDRKGDFKVVIEYQPQKWFVQGFIISLAVLLLCLLYLCLVLVRRRGWSR